MKAEELKNVKSIYLTELEDFRLDPVTVHLFDAGPGAGSLKVSCYGKSWVAFWGGMGERRIEEFVAQCDASYLTGKLAQKQTKQEKEYLMRICQALIQSFRKEL